MADPVCQKGQAITDLERLYVAVVIQLVRPRKSYLRGLQHSHLADPLPKARYRQFSLLPTRILIQTLEKPHN